MFFHDEKVLLSVFILVLLKIFNDGLGLKICLLNFLFHLTTQR